MVSKVELRKFNKEKLFGQVHDRLIQVDKLTSEVKELREEIEGITTLVRRQKPFVADISGGRSSSSGRNDLVFSYYLTLRTPTNSI